MNEGDRKLGRRNLCAAIENGSLVGGMDARENLDQRRLAGAILAEQREHLSALELKADIVERLGAAESLRDALDRKNRVARCGRTNAGIARRRPTSAPPVTGAGLATDERPAAARLIRDTP